VKDELIIVGITWAEIKLEHIKIKEDVTDMPREHDEKLDFLRKPFVQTHY
jgi:flagellar biogenesis protein FliO